MPLDYIIKIIISISSPKKIITIYVSCYRHKAFGNWMSSKNVPLSLTFFITRNNVLWIFWNAAYNYS